MNRKLVIRQQAVFDCLIIGVDRRANVADEARGVDRVEPKSFIFLYWSNILGY